MAARRIPRDHEHEPTGVVVLVVIADEEVLSSSLAYLGADDAAVLG